MFAGNPLLFEVFGAGPRDRAGLTVPEGFPRMAAFPPAAMPEAPCAPRAKAPRDRGKARSFATSR